MVTIFLHVYLQRAVRFVRRRPPHFAAISLSEESLARQEFHGLTRTDASGGMAGRNKPAEFLVVRCSDTGLYYAAGNPGAGISRRIGPVIVGLLVNHQ